LKLSKIKYGENTSKKVKTGFFPTFTYSYFRLSAAASQNFSTKVAKQHCEAKLRSQIAKQNTKKHQTDKFKKKF